jgi:hypothetical protein
VSVERGRVYFWDAIDGAWVRYGRDGLTEISAYKMRNWFREISQLLINKYQSTPPKVVSEFDAYNEELVTFINHADLPSTFRTYANYKGSFFSEDDLRWKSCHNYDPEMFGKLNNQLYAFKNGSIFLMEKGGDSSYSTFFGDKYDVMIEPVFNEIPKNIKNWLNMAIVSTHGWSAPRLLSEFRGSKSKQQSSLALSNFTTKEDVYYAELKKNQNTVNVDNPLIEGDNMRSKAIQALIQLDQEVLTLSLLHYVEMGEIDSPKNL